MIAKVVEWKPSFMDDAVFFVLLVALVLLNVFLYFISDRMRAHAEQVYKDGFEAYDNAKAARAEAQGHYDRAKQHMKTAREIHEETRLLVEEMRRQ